MSLDFKIFHSVYQFSLLIPCSPHYVGFPDTLKLYIVKRIEIKLTCVNRNVHRILFQDDRLNLPPLPSWNPLKWWLKASRKKINLWQLWKQEAVLWVEKIFHQDKLDGLGLAVCYFNGKVCTRTKWRIVSEVGDLIQTGSKLGTGTYGGQEWALDSDLGWALEVGWDELKSRDIPPLGG